MSFLDFEHYFGHSRNQQLIITVNFIKSDSNRALTELIDEKTAYPFETRILQEMCERSMIMEMFKKCLLKTILSKVNYTYGFCEGIFTKSKQGYRFRLIFIYTLLYMIKHSGV